MSIKGDKNTEGRLRGPVDVGRLVAAARRERRIPQERFARQLGVSRKTLSDLERGVAENVSLNTALRALALAGFAELVERRPTWSALARRPLVVALALGVYATTWSFYGSVGFAAKHGYAFLAIHLGVARLEDGQRLLPMGQLASALGVAPGTATTMVKTLAESGLVEYEPYAGVALTPAGEKLAALVVRRHRLIELFLVQVLGFGWDEVHDEAEQLEHVASLIPDEWLEPAATGPPEQCAAKVQGQFDLGADGVILHGASPAELEPIVAAYQDRFA